MKRVVAVLGLCGCSLVWTKRVPDHVTDRQVLACTDDRSLAVVDLVLASVPLVTAANLSSDQPPVPKYQWEVPLAIGIVAVASAIKGFVDVNACQAAEDRLTGLLHERDARVKQSRAAISRVPEDKP